MVIFAHSLVNTVGANMGYHSWQKQERFKGAVNISLSGNASDDFDLNSFSWRNPTGSQWPLSDSIWIYERSWVQLDPSDGQVLVWRHQITGRSKSGRIRVVVLLENPAMMNEASGYTAISKQLHFQTCSDFSMSTARREI